MNCSELRTKLAEIKTLKEELVLKLPQAQNHKDTFILVNLQEEIEKKLEGLEEMLIIDIEELIRRHKEDKTLSKRELQFIYKLDGLFNREIVVEGGGENLENMRRQILRERGRENKIKQDLAKALNCREEQISLTKEEALSGNIKYHYGHLDFPELTFVEDLKLPDHISGGLSFNNLESVETLNLPESIGGDLNLTRLTRFSGLTLPKSIGGYLFLSSITSANGLIFPRSIGSSLNLCKLTDGTGLKLPESIGGYLDIRNLTSAEILKLPNHVSGGVFLNGLESVKTLNLPKEAGGEIYFDKLSRKDKEKLRKEYPHLADKIR